MGQFDLKVTHRRARDHDSNQRTAASDHPVHPPERRRIESGDGGLRRGRPQRTCPSTTPPEPPYWQFDCHSSLSGPREWDAGQRHRPRRHALARNYQPTTPGSTNHPEIREIGRLPQHERDAGHSARPALTPRSSCEAMLIRNHAARGQTMPFWTLAVVLALGFRVLRHELHEHGALAHSRAERRRRDLRRRSPPTPTSPISRPRRSTRSPSTNIVFARSPTR